MNNTDNQDKLNKFLSMKESTKFATRAVRSGQYRTQEAEHSNPIFATSSYVFRTAQEAAERFAGSDKGNVYSRYTNPTVRAFEERLASLEGAEQAVATASGMSAIFSACLAVMQVGDHLVSSRSLFGTTSILFEKYLKRAGMSTSFVSLTDLDAWEQAIKPETKLLFLESPSNPLCEVADISALAEIAHRHDCLLMVDNCFCTPALQQPLTLGADIVMHSATKYIDGQGRCLGGVVAGNADIMDKVVGVLRTTGPAMSPFNAWVFLAGLETLAVRMQAHCANAMQLAQWLASQQHVEKVYYTGLPAHPQHELAKRQQAGFGSMVAFEVVGDQEAAWRVIDATNIFSITANLGDVKSTITHPATTTHGRLSNEDKVSAGIKSNLIRLAIGLESIEDLKADLAGGLALL